MAKIIAAINMTLDGICDHTAVTADAGLHRHYADLLQNSGTVLYGRITYGLMEYWKGIADNPTGEKDTDAFAVIMNNISKIVFSNSLEGVDWETATLAKEDLASTVTALRQQPGKDVLVGSRSLIIQLLQLNLIDEFQLCIHPVIAGEGLRLFEEIKNRLLFTLSHTKQLAGGAVVMYYKTALQ